MKPAESLEKSTAGRPGFDTGSRNNSRKTCKKTSRKSTNYNDNIYKELFAQPNDDEIKVAMILIDQKIAKKILFLAPELKKSSGTPDFVLNGREKWEIKTPKIFTDRALRHLFREALHQSPNVIFYLANARKIPEDNVVRAIKRIFDILKSAKKLRIITRSGKVFDFTK